MTRLTRRRFLTITAAASAIPSMSPAAMATWRGIALGASASMRIDGMDQGAASVLFAAVEAELSRLENIFSLYRPTSEISRLNRNGHLDAPSAELLQVLSLSKSIHAATNGAFDPTVQLLWLAMAENAGPAEIARARSAVGFDRLRFDPDRVYFSGRATAPASAITLNGIAQGAITDRIAALLRARGMKNALIDMGEIAAIGHRPDGTQWRVGIAGSSGAVLHNIRLADRAVATSSSHVTMQGALHSHVVDPTNSEKRVPLTVAVSAPSAAVADGLSTALCLVPNQASPRVLSHFPETQLEVLAV